MSGVAAAVGGAAVLGAVVSTTSAQNSANAQSQASDRANQTQQQQFNAMQNNMSPYVGEGQDAINALGNEATTPGGDLNRKFTMADFQQDPGYQFQLAQGTQAMDRSAAAKGMLNSAGTMEGINAYGQGMANTDYQQALTNFTNNQQQRYNMLAGIAGMGNSTNGQMNTIGMNNANNQGQNMMGSANAQGAASIASGNAMMGGANSLANGYMNTQMMSKFAPQTPASQAPMTGAATASPVMAGGGDQGLISDIG